MLFGKRISKEDQAALKAYLSRVIDITGRQGVYGRAYDKLQEDDSGDAAYLAQLALKAIPDVRHASEVALQEMQQVAVPEDARAHWTASVDLMKASMNLLDVHRAMFAEVLLGRDPNQFVAPARTYVAEMTARSAEAARETTRLAKSAKISNAELARLMAVSYTGKD